MKTKEYIALLLKKDHSYQDIKGSNIEPLAYKYQDALFVENWLCRDDNWGGIISLVDKFIKETKWSERRTMGAFYSVHKYSKKVFW